MQIGFSFPTVTWKVKIGSVVLKIFFALFGHNPAINKNVISHLNKLAFHPPGDPYYWKPTKIIQLSKPEFLVLLQNYGTLIYYGSILKTMKLNHY